MRSEEEFRATVDAGGQRLHPRITNPNWLVLSRRREIFSRWLALLDLKNPKVLDIGGRLQPYRELLPAPNEYYSVDLQPTPLVDVIGDASLLPFPDGVFDLVICTQMLEYAPEPLRVTSEIHRVLQPGGVLLLSAPSIFPRDSDHDAWRFFPAALRNLLSEFSEVSIIAETGSVSGFLRTTAVFLHGIARYPALQWALSFSVFPTLNLLGLAVERIRGPREGSFSVNYSVKAIK